ncbi:alpha/beta fold hydrolase [Bradyrhizobium cenepequi]|uniref:alpha/beta fold hydrolase n=1 Tax=Bradyrhizobium cenepequi TaxID=2821403 RepID=UPI001CE2CBA1|nr:alpha/beta fold hydrolase [Bradyrhizobium cenepequi]MCA6108280.1 alpha/beta fold hydrolase [Bradyrhizobium cenepequi]
MASISLRDGVLDIVESGAGKPIVLLHSLLADRTIFDKIVPALARTRRVIVPDLPGFGGSSSAGATIEAIADRISGLFGALNLGATADVLGNGFGGFVASTLAIRHGGKFDRLVLADTGMSFSPEGKQSFYAMAERVRKAGMGAIIEVAMKRLFPEDYIAAHPEIATERRNALLNTNPEFFAEACLALAALDLTSGIATIRNPTLVVVGELDAATPPEMARALAKALPKADLIEIPGCGHAPMAQSPGTFIKTISDFLALT